MRLPTTRTLRLAALGLGLVACNGELTTAPATIASLHPSSFTAPTGPQDVRISEFHYDNASTDVGEAIEISGPAGTDLSGWSIVRYNGTSTPTAAPIYTSPGNPSLSGVVIPATSSCGSRGVVVLSYPQDGLQNGASDGFALLNKSGAVVEFLSYEGTITAAAGTPAAGETSTDVGVSESGSENGTSIKRVYNSATKTFTWVKSAPQTFNACDDDNSGDAAPPPAVVSSVVVSPAEATVQQGGSQQFTAQAKDAQGNVISGATFSWSVAETGIASVDGNGLVTTTGAGDVHVTATSGGVSGGALLHSTAPPPPPPPGDLPNIRFSEIHYDNVGTDANEAIEIEGPTGTDLTGWSIVLYDGSVSTSTTPNRPAGSVYGTTTLAAALTGSCNGRGVLVVNYPVNGIQNGGGTPPSASQPAAADGFALVDATGHVVEFLSYEGTVTAVDGPANGMTSRDIGQVEGGTTTAQQSLQRTATGSWNPPAASSFGFANACGAPPPPTKSLSFSGRDPVTDPPLPVSFQDQLFATEKDNGATVTTTFTWSSDTPDVASIDQQGVFTALREGTAILRATAADGTTGTTTLQTTNGTHSSIPYSGNTEFGDPTDGNPSDDYIVRRPEYTTSFSSVRNTPNWVSYKLDASYYNSGTLDRCDCFTYDPQLPASYVHYTTADYTGAGAAAGYGIDRGHLARSFDRTAASLDNAATFYFSNIIPQASDLNQGPWALMENELGDSATSANREVYVVAGVIGNKGTVKNEGKIVIPTQVWKVAVILPHGQGLGDVHSWRDLTVIAVVMPNDPGVRNVPWRTYRTTVDEVERLSGYDVLSLLPDDIETVVEGPAPVAAAMDVQPEIISLSSTSTVTAYLLSSATFDATTATPASIHLRVVNGTGDGAPVAMRGSAYLTTITDVNGDGLPDRMLVFQKSALVAAGLSTSNSQLVLEDVSGSVRFRATDSAPPTVAP
jgi:DNA/RNA endonuclease G (NUC1)